MYTFDLENDMISLSGILLYAMSHKSTIIKIKNPWVCRSVVKGYNKISEFNCHDVTSCDFPIDVA